MSEPENKAASVAKVALAVAGAAVAIFSLLSGSGSNTDNKTMKAPGKNERIRRKDFEDDPKTYFQDLRNKK
jgi:hypothetical protein|uniref:Uncharacterized protein n=1 Tax=Fagus sylvatica TaxID=28930 RepID=A0A2N9EUY8_FAGSY